MRAFLVPHVPYMLQELGGKQFSLYLDQILSSFDRIKRDLELNPPDALLICSPHYEGKSFRIGTSKRYKGNFANFRRPDIEELRQGNSTLSHQIQNEGEKIGFLTPQEENPVSEIDYGSLVPLRLLDPNATIPIIPVSISLGSQKEHFIWGQKLHEIVSKFTNNVVFIASTELTQDFSDQPDAFPSNEDEDREFIEFLKNSNVDKMCDMYSSYFKQVENELLPTFILAGFASKLQGELYSYSGLIGCGCAIIGYE